MHDLKKGNVAAAQKTCEPAVLGVGQTAPSIATEDKITSQSIAVSKKN